MEKFSFQNCQDQKIIYRQLPQLLDTYTERLESATEISSNQQQDDANGNCGAFDLAPTRQPLKLNDVQIQSDSYNKKQEQIQNPYRIIREGYLEKSTQSFFNKWQMCYCVLTASKLYFFQDHMRVKMNSCINLSVHGSKIQRDGQVVRIRLEQYEEVICLKIYTERQVEGWMDNIGSIIQYHINSSKVKLLQSKKYIYLEKDAILQNQFISTADTGDILLMTTTDTQCAIQRFVTNSQYDHIAMVVKFHGQVKIFQSNADDGVNIYDWAQFQACFHQYQKISLRKLHHHHGKPQSNTQLMNFIKSSIGKKYELKALKLIRKSSEDEHHSTRGYFCSELIAKVYKIIGLLQNEKASSNYWPVDFTMRGGINLLKSASLGNERPIILNRHLKFGL